MNNMQITENDLIFELTDTELLSAVEKFLSIQANNFDYARYKGIQIDLESIAIYCDWCYYWYRLKNGKSLTLNEVKAICGSACTVQIIVSNGKSKYLIGINPNMEEWI